MNDIFFITDQQRADHLGCAGNEVLQTPNIDKLASEGVRFTNAYVANPTCMPNPELRHELAEKLLFEVIKQQSIYPKKQAMA